MIEWCPLHYSLCLLIQGFHFRLCYFVCLNFSIYGTVSQILYVIFTTIASSKPWETSIPKGAKILCIVYLLTYLSVYKTDLSLRKCDGTRALDAVVGDTMRFKNEGPSAIKWYIVPILSHTTIYTYIHTHACTRMHTHIASSHISVPSHTHTVLIHTLPFHTYIS